MAVKEKFLTVKVSAPEEKIIRYLNKKDPKTKNKDRSSKVAKRTDDYTLDIDPRYFD